MTEGLQPDILFIGCGNMGGALAAGYRARQPAGRLLVVDPNIEGVRAKLPGGDVTIVPTIEQAGAVRPGMVVLAVKPQAMAEVLPQVAALPAADGLVVSIAAGTSATYIAGMLPRARIVRAMPNTPALVGAGITGLWASPTVTDADRERCEALFGAVGQARWVAQEPAIDAITAVSGSGPAYFFAFVEALGLAGAQAGLEPGLANELARATLIGAAAMLAGTTDAPGALKAAVRSPQGTTDAALRVFESGEALQRLVGQAVAAADRRARALSGTAA